MKFPLWLKNPRTGKIERCVPMQTFPDGRVGYWYHLIFGQGYENPYWRFYKDHGGKLYFDDTAGTMGKMRILVKE